MKNAPSNLSPEKNHPSAGELRSVTDSPGITDEINALSRFIIVQPTFDSLSVGSGLLSCIALFTNYLMYSKAAEKYLDDHTNRSLPDYISAYSVLVGLSAASIFSSYRIINQIRLRHHFYQGDLGLVLFIAIYSAWCIAATYYVDNSDEALWKRIGITALTFITYSTIHTLSTKFMIENRKIQFGFLTLCSLGTYPIINYFYRKCCKDLLKNPKIDTNSVKSSVTLQALQSMIRDISWKQLRRHWWRCRHTEINDTEFVNLLSIIDEIPKKGLNALIDSYNHLIPQYYPVEVSRRCFYFEKSVTLIGFLFGAIMANFAAAGFYKPSIDLIIDLVPTDLYYGIPFTLAQYYGAFIPTVVVICLMGKYGGDFYKQTIGTIFDIGYRQFRLPLPTQIYPKLTLITSGLTLGAAIQSGTAGGYIFIEESFHNMTGCEWLQDTILTMAKPSTSFLGMGCYYFTITLIFINLILGLTAELFSTEQEKKLVRVDEMLSNLLSAELSQVKTNTSQNRSGLWSRCLTRLCCNDTSKQGYRPISEHTI